MPLYLLRIFSISINNYIKKQKKVKGKKLFIFGRNIVIFLKVLQDEREDKLVKL
jgi:hypothetical protein